MSKNMPKVVYLQARTWTPEKVGGCDNVEYVLKSAQYESLTSHVDSQGKINTHLAVVLNGEYSDEFIHWIEQELDRPLLYCGFSHTGTTREDSRVVLHYYQFAVSVKDGES